MSRRMVLPTIIMTAKMSSTDAIRTTRRMKSRMAFRRSTHCVSIFTMSMLARSVSSAASSASSIALVASVGRTTRVCGSGLLSSVSSTSPSPDDSLNSTKASSARVTTTESIMSIARSSAASPSADSGLLAIAMYIEKSRTLSQPPATLRPFCTRRFNEAGNARAIPMTQTVRPVATGCAPSSCRAAVQLRTCS